MIATKGFCRAVAGTKDVKSVNEVKPMGETLGDIRQSAAKDALPKAEGSRDSL
jgi:hypothetical protein